MPPKTRTGAGPKKVRRKEKKNVAHGHAHIKSTFNNTIVSITDPQGAVIAWASAGHVGFKGSPQVDSVRRADGRRERGPQGAGARHAQGGRLREGPRFRPGDRDPFAAGRRPSRSAPFPTSPRSRTTAAVRPSGAGSRGGEPDMARYTGPMTRKSRRLKVDLVGGDQAFERRPYPPGQHGRIRIKETEYLLQSQEKQKGPLRLRRAGEAVPPLLRRGQPSRGQDR